MQGHAAANSIPIIASNRTGVEKNKKFSMTFYGSSFIANECGQKIKECSRDQQEFIIHEFDLDAVELYRSSWGFFRDRRTDLYKDIFKD
jgi:N-carbamoylputrescine amidase